MKIVVYWEHSDEESTAKKAARYLLSMFRKRGMPKAEILVRSVGAGLADEAQRLADQMEAAFGEHKDATDSWTFEDEVRAMAAQTQMPGIIFGDPTRDRSGWTLADINAMRIAPNPSMMPKQLPKGDPGPALPRSAPDATFLGTVLSSAEVFGMLSEPDPATLKATFTPYTPPGVHE